MLDDESDLDLLVDAAAELARAEVPAEVAESLTLARMTALSKKGGGARGIATGTSLRRLVARILARQVAPEIEAACAPFQYALSTRAGTDCVGHLLRIATDADPLATVLSIDGVGAYDHVSREAMLSKLSRLPSASALLPFVRLSYGEASCYSWVDDQGEQHNIVQGDGREQGDPLMPLLFSLGELAWARRWTRMLSTTCASAFAASLVEPRRELALHAAPGGDAPTLAALFDAEQRSC